MKRYTLAFASLCCLAFVPVGTASAQPYPVNRPSYSPYSRPQLSPYLDLIRGGDPAANYYLGTVPERERRRNDAYYRSSILELDQRISQTPESDDLFTPLRSTGHATAFGTTGSYFGSTGMPLSATRPATPAGPKPTRR